MTEDTVTKPSVKKVKIQKRGIGTVIKEAILANKTNQEALEAAKAEFPNSNTTVSTVSWYRNQLRKDGIAGVPTARALKKQVPDTPEAVASNEETRVDPLA